MDARPLHQDVQEPDQVWGRGLHLACACGNKHDLWQPRCGTCRKKNPFARLLKKRARIERWFDRRIQGQVFPELTKANMLLQAAHSYAQVVSEVVKHPFPQRHKDEDINRFLKRVTNYFPSMFKSTSPKQMAVRTSETVRRTANALARTSWTSCERLVDEVVANQSHRRQGDALGEQADLVSDDLLTLSKSYVEALRTLQLTHSRMVTAYNQTRAILQREHAAGKGKSLWNKARAMVKPIGKILKFKTAVWQSEEELEQLKRLDAAMGKFIDQAQRIDEHTRKLSERTDRQMNAYKLSMRRYLVRALVERVQSAKPDERRRMSRRLLSRKGIGSFLWRLVFGARN